MVFCLYGLSGVYITLGKDGIFIPGIPVGKTNVRGEDVNVNLFSDPNQLSFVTVQLINIGSKEEGEKLCSLLSSRQFSCLLFNE